MLFLLATSCIVNAPEELEILQPVPPKILAHNAVPPTVEIYRTDNSETDLDPTFSVQYTAALLDEVVEARLYLNWGARPPTSVGKVEASGQVPDDSPGIISVPFGRSYRGEPPGCYTLTLAIAAASNFGGGNVPVPVDEDQADFITWWIAHDIDPQDVTLDMCPQLGDDASTASFRLPQ